MNIQKKNITARIINGLSSVTEQPILICYKQQTITTKTLIIEIKTRQTQLIEAGVQAGQKVFVSTERANLYWIDLLALWSIEAIVIPLDASLSTAEQNILFEVVQPHFIITPDSVIQRKYAHDVLRTPLNLAAILLTSGSTGTPKGVMLTHDALLHNADAVLRKIDLSAQDTLGIAMKFQFTSAICHFLAAMLTGACFVSTEQKLSHVDLALYLKATGVNCFGGSPLQIGWLVDCQPKVMLSLKWLMSSGDHLNTAIRKQCLISMPNTKLYVVYGLTEVGGRLCFHNADLCLQENGMNIVGKPIDDDIRLAVLSEDKIPCKVGEVGEVYVSGDHIFSGYYQLEHQDFANQCFKTGDFGYLDEVGNLVLMGRRDQVFKCAGKKVSTYPICNALQKLSFLKDFVVMPMEHDILGYIPCVVYSLKAGCEFHKAQVLSTLRKTLPSNHIPRTYVETACVPRTGSGKPKYQEIKQILTEALSPVSNT